MKVLETRRKGPLTMRRYRKDCGRTVKTMELPWQLWLAVRPSVLRGLPGFEKAEAARDRIAEIEALLTEGFGPNELAKRYGVSRQYVARIKSRLLKPRQRTSVFDLG